MLAALVKSRNVTALYAVSVFGLFTWKQSLAYSTLPSTTFRPLYNKYPEVEKLYADEPKMQALFTNFSSKTSFLSHETESKRERQFNELYLPTFLYVNEMFQRHRSAEPNKPLFLGVSAPQVLLILQLHVGEHFHTVTKFC